MSIKSDDHQSSRQFEPAATLNTLEVPDRLGLTLMAGVGRTRSLEHGLQYKDSDGQLKRSLLVYDGAVITLTYDGDGRVANFPQRLTRNQWSWLTQYANNHAEALTEPRVNPSDCLERGIAYACLHSAFYASPASPLEAATLFTKFVRDVLKHDRSDWSGLKMSIHTKLPSSDERFEYLMRQSESLASMLSYMQTADGRGEAEGAMKQLTEVGLKFLGDLEQKNGREVLKTILGPNRTASAAINLLDAITRTEERLTEMRAEETMPVRIDLKVLQQQYPLYNSHIYVERSPSGIGVSVFYQSGDQTTKEVPNLESLALILVEASKVDLKQPRWPQFKYCKLTSRPFGT